MKSITPHNWLYNGTVITFDQIADGTVVDNLYANRGVTFASITNNPPSQGHAFARKSPSAESPSNVISVIAAPHAAGFNGAIGGIQATFMSPQLLVSIDALPILPPEFKGTPTNKPFLQAFDAAGHVAYTVFYGPNYGDPAYGTWQPLIITSTSANIVSVVFSSEHSSSIDVFAIFDRLVFATRLPIIKLGPPHH